MNFLAQILEIAGPFLTVAAIVGVGYKVGEHFGSQSAQRNCDDAINDANTLTSAARSQGDAWREETMRWKSKYAEISPHIGSLSAAQKLDEVRKLIDAGGSIWFEPPLTVPPIRSISMGGRAVITVANLKGGVGKTTISTHLAAALGANHRVLFLDLDFQGSGSTFLLQDAGRDDVGSLGERARAAKLLDSHISPADLLDLAISLGAATPGVHVIQSHHKLADAEERLMLRWAIGDEPEDVRFNLRKLLHAEGLPWDVIVIDGPPRLSTAMAQALAASTHVLIPTQYESKSTEATLYFVETLQTMRERGVCPSLEILGIVPSVTPPDREIRGDERKYLQETVAPKVARQGALWHDVSIPQRAAFRRTNLVKRDSSNGGIEAQGAIDALTKKVRARIWHDT